MDLNEIRHIANDFITFYKCKKWNSQIWFYKNKKWISNFNISLEAMLDGYLLNVKHIETKIKDFNEIKARIEHTLELEQDIEIDNTSPIVYLNNGFLDLNGFTPYTEEEQENKQFIPFTIDANYLNEKELDKEHFNKVKHFIENVFLTEDAKAIRKTELNYFLAHCFLMLSSYQAKNFLIIAGDSNTGKSKLAKLITNLAGNYINSFNPEKVNDFFYAGFLNKTGAIAPDIKASWLEPTMIKKITGDDLTEINQKHKATFNAELYTTPLIFTNTDIGYKELSNALSNRIVIIETYIDFVNNKELGLSKVEADKLINDKRTKSCFLYLCYQGFKNTWNETTGLLKEPETSKILKIDIEASNNKIYSWLEETGWLDNQIKDGYVMVYKELVYDAYRTYYLNTHNEEKTGFKYTPEGLFEEFRQTLKNKYKYKYIFNFMERSSTTTAGRKVPAYKIELRNFKDLTKQGVIMSLNDLYDKYRDLKTELDSTQDTINKLKKVKTELEKAEEEKTARQEAEIKQQQAKAKKVDAEPEEHIEIQELTWNE